ncbi:MAG: RNase adapter RapZ [Rhodospirillaceae bacterium]|nr:RNase adapter RapZ [Rhodospirillaceae bacterium]MYH37607.1 RNase adapter RapZ [Rhodospirillaceae bacterium]MYK13371.1 RNase adapter RapZ [Rhodospirillaceae bacterium]
MTKPRNSQEQATAGNASGPQLLVLVTGLSGAGKSTALAALEDIGFTVVDNLPLAMLDGFVGPGGTDRKGRRKGQGERPVALGIDVRARDFDTAAMEAAARRILARSDIDARLIFLDCADEILVQRYSETRRRHPLARERPVLDGVRLERQMIAPLRSLADPVIDTTDETVNTLRRRVQDRFPDGGGRQLSVFVESFGYGHGVPRHADLVFDVRFLRNPHYVESLRPTTGLDAQTGDYIAGDPDFQPFFDRLTDMLALLLPRYRAEGKSYLTIAIGCTGGRHRSVYVAQRTAAWLAGSNWPHTLRHRDLGRDGPGRDAHGDYPAHPA